MVELQWIFIFLFRKLIHFFLGFLNFFRIFIGKRKDMLLRSLFTESKKLRVFDFDDTSCKNYIFYLCNQ